LILTGLYNKQRNFLLKYTRQDNTIETILCFGFWKQSVFFSSLVDETESASDDESSVSELFCNGKAISPNRFALVNLKAVVDTVFVMPVVRAISQNTSTDLLMKRIQVKRSICNIRTSATESLYGSQLSLTSLNSEIPLGTPMVFERTPLRRSLIPRVSQYQRSMDMVILKNEAMLSPIRQ